MAGRTALVVGATGLVGGHLLGMLLENERYAAVTVLTAGPLVSSTRSCPNTVSISTRRKLSQTSPPRTTSSAALERQ